MLSGLFKSKVPLSLIPPTPGLLPSASCEICDSRRNSNHHHLSVPVTSLSLLPSLVRNPAPFVARLGTGQEECQSCVRALACPPPPPCSVSSTHVSTVFSLHFPPIASSLSQYSFLVSLIPPPAPLSPSLHALPWLYAFLCCFFFPADTVTLGDLKDLASPPTVMTPHCPGYRHIYAQLPT